MDDASPCVCVGSRRDDTSESRDSTSDSMADTIGRPGMSISGGGPDVAVVVDVRVAVPGDPCST